MHRVKIVRMTDTRSIWLGTRAREEMRTKGSKTLLHTLCLFKVVFEPCALGLVPRSSCEIDLNPC
jgi:hypothetical protein